PRARRHGRHLGDRAEAGRTGEEAVKPAAILLVGMAAANALGATGSCPAPPKPGDPISGLTADELQRFQEGREVFERVFTPEPGPGPLFNAAACGECHEDPAVGGTGDEIELHASALRPDGVCDPLAAHGGPVFQLKVTPALKAALGIDAEPVP